MTYSLSGAAFAGAAFAFWASAASSEPFAMPESAIYDAANDRVIVSNINEGFTEADGNGYLSTMGTDGALIQQDWVTGLHGPKGMAILGGRLFVADVNGLAEVDLDTAQIVTVHEAPNAVFLNDVTASGDAVFVSDLLTDTIWRLKDGGFAPWVTDPTLSHPNGLAWDGERLLVGSWGQGLREDFTTEAAGDLLSIDPVSMEISVVAYAVGNIDGVVVADGRILLSDWVKGALIEIRDGAPETVGTYAAGLADIGSDGQTLFLPHMLEGRVEVIPLP